MAEQPPLRILSFDGGGVRGASSLCILKEIMSQVSRQRAVDCSNAPKMTPRPCDLFDLICGTNTGGLIALLLGRLEMVLYLLLNQSLTLADRWRGSYTLCCLRKEDFYFQVKNLASEVRWESSWTTNEASYRIQRFGFWRSARESESWCLQNIRCCN